MSAPTTTPTRAWRPGATRRLLPIVDALSIACVALATLLLVWPSTPDVPNANAAQVPTDREPAMAVPSRAATAPGADSLIAVVVNGNVFSATRRAPASRFVVPGSAEAASAEAASAAAASMTSPSESAGASATVGDSMPRLTGIVTHDGERQALLQLTADDGVPRLYRRGESHAGYRIERIGADFVVLASRSGTRTLRLMSRATPDSLEVP